ncbi:MAG: hypothetical protein CMH58_05295 [Myxococcales bacterium]|nr:hypothetical protein [Myxococcales bacterium]
MSKDEFSEEQKVDRYRAVFYAGASGDFNPIHIDPSVGEKAGFGGPILHGLCTAAWMVDADSRHVGDPRKIKSMRTRFSAPVRLGDRLSFKGTLQQENEDGTQTYGIEAVNQDEEAVLKRSTVTVGDV